MNESAIKTWFIIRSNRLKKTYFQKCTIGLKKFSIHRYYEIFTFLTNHKNLYSNIKEPKEKRKKKVEKLGELAQS